MISYQISHKLSEYCPLPRGSQWTRFKNLIRKITTFWPSKRKNIRLISIIKLKQRLILWSLVLTHFVYLKSLDNFWHFLDLQQTFLGLTIIIKQGLFCTKLFTNEYLRLVKDYYIDGRNTQFCQFPLYSSPWISQRFLNRWMVH